MPRMSFIDYQSEAIKELNQMLPEGFSVSRDDQGMVEGKFPDGDRIELDTYTFLDKDTLSYEDMKEILIDFSMNLQVINEDGSYSDPISYIESQVDNLQDRIDAVSPMVFKPDEFSYQYSIDNFRYSFNNLNLEMRQDSRGRNAISVRVENVYGSPDDRVLNFGISIPEQDTDKEKFHTFANIRIQATDGLSMDNIKEIYEKLADTIRTELDDVRIGDEWKEELKDFGDKIQDDSFSSVLKEDLSKCQDKVETRTVDFGIENDGSFSTRNLQSFFKEVAKDTGLTMRVFSVRNDSDHKIIQVDQQKEDSDSSRTISRCAISVGEGLSRENVHAYFDALKEDIDNRIIELDKTDSDLSIFEQSNLTSLSVDMGDILFHPQLDFIIDMDKGGNDVEKQPGHKFIDPCTSINREGQIEIRESVLKSYHDPSGLAVDHLKGELVGVANRILQLEKTIAQYESRMPSSMLSKNSYYFKCIYDYAKAATTYYRLGGEIGQGCFVEKIPSFTNRIALHARASSCNAKTSINYGLVELRNSEKVPGSVDTGQVDNSFPSNLKELLNDFQKDLQELQTELKENNDLSADQKEALQDRLSEIEKSYDAVEKQYNDLTQEEKDALQDRLESFKESLDSQREALDNKELSPMDYVKQVDSLEKDFISFSKDIGEVYYKGIDIDTMRPSQLVDPGTSLNLDGKIELREEAKNPIHPKMDAYNISRLEDVGNKMLQVQKVLEKYENSDMKLEKNGHYFKAVSVFQSLATKYYALGGAVGKDQLVTKRPTFHDRVVVSSTSPSRFGQIKYEVEPLKEEDKISVEKQNAREEDPYARPEEKNIDKVGQDEKEKDNMEKSEEDKKEEIDSSEKDSEKSDNDSVENKENDVTGSDGKTEEDPYDKSEDNVDNENDRLEDPYDQSEEPEDPVDNDQIDDEDDDYDPVD